MLALRTISGRPSASAALVLGATIVYVLVYMPLAILFGNAAGILAVVPVIVAGWTLGRRAGLLAGILSFPVTSLLVLLLSDLEWRDWVGGGGVLGTGALILVGGVVGHLTDLKARITRSLGGSRGVEDALRESETRLRLALGAAAMTTYEHDAVTGRHALYGDLRQVYGLGLSATTMTHKAFLEMVHPEDREWFARDGERSLETGIVPTIEFRFVRPDGEVRWIEGRSELVYDDEGKAVRIIGVNIDITERKRVEQALRDTETRLRSALDAAGITVYEVDAQTGEHTHYGALQQVYGLDPSVSAMSREVFLEMVHPEDREWLAREDERVVETGSVPTLEFRLLLPDGEVRWIERRSVIINNGDDKPVRIIGANIDVTERKRAEQALRESEARLRMAMDAASLSVWERDRQAGEISFYGSVGQLYGFDKDASVVAYSEMLERIHPEDRERIIQDDSRAFESGTVQHIEFRVIRSDGEVRWIEGRGEVINDLAGKAVRMIGVNIDVTGRKRAEQAQRDSDTRLRLALEAAGLSTWEMGWEKGQISFYGSVGQLYGFDENDLVVSYGEMLDKIHPEDRERIIRDDARAFESGTLPEIEFRIVSDNGGIRWVEGRGEVISDDTGKVVRIVGVNIDVTERKLLQEQLLHSQKMEAVGELAGSMAHDFNNLLTPVLGFASLAATKIPPDHPVSDYLEQIRNAAERAATLIHQLLVFSSRRVTDPKLVNLTDLVLDTDKMLRQLIGGDIELVCLPGPDLGTVRVDAGQITQVLVNMAVNARDAMPDGGKLTVETQNVTVGPDFAPQLPDLTSGQYVKLSVSDTGVGMDDDVKSRLFEPFFTTKELGRGTGLGLATCYGIVKHCGGDIAVRSEPDRGATFDIYLPQAEVTAAHTGGGEEVACSRGGTETVLLVEDEPSVRKLVAEVQQQQGYRVLEATNGEEALRVAGRHAKEDVQLLLTDLVMPRMGGRELAERLLSQAPEVKVLFTSGYPDDASIQRGASHVTTSFLQKPFTPAIVAQKVREVLDTVREPQ